MKHLGKLIFFFLFISEIAHAQVALNGTVKIFPYSGLQPQLIEGVSPLPAVNEPLLRHVYLVDKNIVALTIDERALIYSSLKPYLKQEGDTVIMGDYHGKSKILVRNGQEVGYICGLKNNWVRPYNEMAGEKLDVEKVIKPKNFRLTSVEDASFNTPQIPDKIYRKTEPVRRTHISKNQQFVLRHEIYLVFEDDLQPGAKYSFQFGSDVPLKEPVSFNFNCRKLRTEAIHVNLQGYSTKGPKVAFLSAWLGDGGRHSFKISDFMVVDAISGKTVFSGNATLNDKINDNNHTNVYSLDFSAFRKPGMYRVVILGIGCSFDFEISDKIWEQTARLMMKGFLHQRSGIALGPPYTDYLRPENMHPKDIFKVHKCDVEKFFNVDENGQSGVFERIQASILPETEIPEAWGGWMDAGDFDMRMSHLYSVRMMMYLYETNPDYFETLDLNIPESKNNIPDILDEGMWCLDLFRRTQGVYEKGGISWWVEMIEHPRGGEPSWLQSLPAALVPPTPRACFHYATTAAQMSVVVEKYDKELSKAYLKSAADAINWADSHVDAPDPFGRNPRNVIEALAYVNLYRKTGDKIWYDRLEDLIRKVFPNGIINDVRPGNAEILVNYVLLNTMEINPEIKKTSEQALLKLADDLLAGAQQNTYSILNPSDRELDRLVLSSRNVLPVLMAHQITGDKKYTDILSQTIQYSMGNNPMNRSYISGLGERWFIPYQHDWESANMPAPAGIPNFGPAVQTKNRWGWTGPWAAEMIENAGLYPNKLLDWPFAEKCFNNAWIAPVNEFTVRQPMGDLLLLSGYLAQENY